MNKSKSKTILINWPLGDVFSNYLVIFLHGDFVTILSERVTYRPVKLHSKKNRGCLKEAYKTPNLIELTYTRLKETSTCSANNFLFTHSIVFEQQIQISTDQFPKQKHKQLAPLTGYEINFDLHLINLFRTFWHIVIRRWHVVLYAIRLHLSFSHTKAGTEFYSRAYSWWLPNLSLSLSVLVFVSVSLFLSLSLFLKQVEKSSHDRGRVPIDHAVRSS